MTQDLGRALHGPGSIYGEAGSQAVSAANFWASEGAGTCQLVLIQVRGTQPKGVPARVVGA